MQNQRFHRAIIGICLLSITITSPAWGDHPLPSNASKLSEEIGPPPTPGVRRRNDSLIITKPPAAKASPSASLSDEAIRLADQLIASGNDEGHLIKGLALARKGMWTEALKEYAEGLKQSAGSAENARGLRELLESHPAFIVPPPLLQDDPKEPDPTPELDEAMKLANQAIENGQAEGYLVKAEALAKRGAWNDAVRTYALGLEKLSKSPEHVQGLRYLIQNHPLFSIPDAAIPADPKLSEKYLSDGLYKFWARKYAEAEKDFYESVRHDSRDAVSLYFLGLARLAQGKQAIAFEAFRQGGRLEQQNRPSSTEVSVRLERIQGPSRILLDRYRP